MRISKSFQKKNVIAPPPEAGSISREFLTGPRKLVQSRRPSTQLVQSFTVSNWPRPRGFSWSERLRCDDKILYGRANTGWLRVHETRLCNYIAYLDSQRPTHTLDLSDYARMSVPANAFIGCTRFAHGDHEASQLRDWVIRGEYLSANSCIRLGRYWNERNIRKKANETWAGDNSI